MDLPGLVSRDYHRGPDGVPFGLVPHVPESKEPKEPKVAVAHLVAVSRLVRREAAVLLFLWWYCGKIIEMMPASSLEVGFGDNRSSKTILESRNIQKQAL